MKNNQLKTSDEWQKLCLIKIIDPDGWDRLHFEFSWYVEKITRLEFERRLFLSTVEFHTNDLLNIWKDLKTE